MDIREEFKSAGVYPSGPVSAWPQERNRSLLKAHAEQAKATQEIEQARGYGSLEGMSDDELREYRNRRLPGVGKMAQGLMKTAGAALVGGRVSREIRDERYATCQACPL